MPDIDSDKSEEFRAAEARLQQWLREDLGIAERRRLARLDPDTALVSKFEVGFAPHLHAILDRLPELLDERTVLDAYARAAGDAAPGTSRLEAWDRAMRGLLREACEREGITDGDDQQAFVRVGVDSVRAVMESVLWSEPLLEDAGYAPGPGERAAYLDVTRRFGNQDLFTRTYGRFEERTVVNHCPGAAYARVMLAQAWRACTGVEAPSA